MRAKSADRIDGAIFTRLWLLLLLIRRGRLLPFGQRFAVSVLRLLADLGFPEQRVVHEEVDRRRADRRNVEVEFLTRLAVAVEEIVTAGRVTNRETHAQRLVLSGLGWWDGGKDVRLMDEAARFVLAGAHIEREDVIRTHDAAAC